ncbi:MAG: NAD(P)-dependent glycerol-3-phosphate dehydrogenase [Nitrospinae bacterium]|nr:NAD(P)-dependent glycerol-3-phosphate dehydrogenase [Nitrospinota bacterium]
MKRVAVIGAGSWGTTLANLLADRELEVGLWVYERDLCQVMIQKRENPLYLPGFPLSPGVHPASSLEEVARGAESFITVCPSQTLRGVIAELVPFLPFHPLIVSASKGLEKLSLYTCSQVLEEAVPAALQPRIAVLSGPSFAREVSQGHPTLVVASSKEPEAAGQVQRLFSTSAFRVYTNTDMLGVELGAALKNVIAIAAGISDGLRFGHNARAALITRGLAEIARLGVAMGASPLTFSGLAGMGDLVLTCTGDLSRNRSLGLRLGQGQRLEEILREMKAIAEGVETVQAAVALGRRYPVEMPISEAVHAVLYEGKRPQEAVAELMGRAPRPEFEEWLIA